MLKAHHKWLSQNGSAGQKADLCGADLGNLYLGAADLRKADLRKADLRGANLVGANLGEANLGDADLRGANLVEANLRNANLLEAKLGGADLIGANLCGASLGKANLHKAHLNNADLREARLEEADLGGADLKGADLEGANFAPANTNELRVIGAKGLSTIRLSENLTGVRALRNVLKESSLRNEERALTSALRKHALQGDDWELWIEGLLFGGWITDFGSRPWESIKVLGGLLLLFCIPYIIALRKANTRAGIWVTHIADKVYRACRRTPLRVMGYLLASLLPLYRSYL